MAARHNVDQEVRKKWDFKDRLLFLRRRYLRDNAGWTKQSKSDAQLALGYKSVQTLNPLLQLVAGSAKKWGHLLSIVTNKDLKVSSEAKFKCLQGTLTGDQIEDLLEQVANGKLTLEDMAKEANTIKLDVRVKLAAVTVLNFNNFDEVIAKYGEYNFGVNRRRSFFPMFAKARGGRNATKSGKQKASHIPEGFIKYVDSVRVQKGLKKRGSSTLNPQHMRSGHWMSTT